MTRAITGYRLTVRHGRLAGTVRDYLPANRTRARRYADRLDLEYGAICCTLAPIFSDPIAQPAGETWRCSAGAVAAEHAAEVGSMGL